MKNSKLVQIAELGVCIEILSDADGEVNYWLIGTGFTAPLSKMNDPHYGSYCYLTKGSGEELVEYRVYQDGKVCY